MNCKHKNKLSLYGRDEKTWTSSEKLCGNMIYICKDCGIVFELEPVAKKIVKNKAEVKDHE